jgi:hypothetical protein
MIEELHKEEEDRKKGMSYGPNPKKKKKDTGVKEGRKRRLSCKHCNSTSHVRNTSSKCPKNPKNAKLNEDRTEPQKKKAKDAGKEASSGSGIGEAEPDVGVEASVLKTAIVTPVKRAFPGDGVDANNDDGGSVAMERGMLLCCTPERTREGAYTSNLCTPGTQDVSLQSAKIDCNETTAALATVIGKGQTHPVTSRTRKYN